MLNRLAVHLHVTRSQASRVVRPCTRVMSTSSRFPVSDRVAPELAKSSDVWSVFSPLAGHVPKDALNLGQASRVSTQRRKSRLAPHNLSTQLTRSRWCDSTGVHELGAGRLHSSGPHGSARDSREQPLPSKSALRSCPMRACRADPAVTTAALASERIRALEAGSIQVPLAVIQARTGTRPEYRDPGDRGSERGSV